MYMSFYVVRDSTLCGCKVNSFFSFSLFFCTKSDKRCIFFLDVDGLDLCEDVTTRQDKRT